MRCLQGAPADQAGQGLLLRQVLQVPGHVPVIIRGRRRSGRNAGAGYERTDWLPVNELGGQRGTRRTGHSVVSTQSTRYRNAPAPLLSRADGQLTGRANYYSHLGLRPSSKDFDYNQPLIREGPNDYILLRNGQKKLVRSVGPRAAPQVQHDGTIRPRASPGGLVICCRCLAQDSFFTGPVFFPRSFRGAFKRVMPSERFRGGRAGACRV